MLPPRFFGHNAFMIARIDIPTGSCLITRLAEDLSGRSAQELRQTLILLPTRRLHLHLAAHLAENNDGASWLPRMLTWDQFVADSCEEKYDQNLVMVSTLAEIVCSDVVADQNRPGINTRHAHELLHLLKELWRHNVRNTALPEMFAWLDRQWHLSEEASLQIRSRLNDVFGILNAFETQLEQHGFILQEALQAKAIESLIADINDGHWKPSHPRIIVAGMTSLPASHLELLTALAQFTGIEAWLDQPWHGLGVAAPLRHIRNRLNFKMETTELPLTANVRGLHACHDLLTESAVALNLVQLALDGGVALHRIGIFVPDETQYASTLALLSEARGISRNIPLARPWVATQAGQWFSLLTEWIDRHEAIGFARLILHPITRGILQGNDPQCVMDDEALQQQLGSWLTDATAILEHSSSRELSLQTNSALTDEFKNLMSCGWRLLSGGDRSEFFAQFRYWSDIFLPHIEQQRTFAAEATEEMGWQSLVAATEALSSIPHSLLVSTGSWQSVLQAIGNLARETSPRETGEPLSGLQIISITEARYVPCDVAIIVGCAEGIFPQKLPQDSLVDNSLKQAGQMPGWRQLEALEDTTFGLLAARVPHLELTWPTTLNDTPVVRSRWVESLHAAGIPVTHHDARDLIQQLSTASMPTTKDLDEGPEGLVPNPERMFSKVSASSLKALMNCPYQFLLRQRGIKSLIMRREEDPLVIGSLLHRVIEFCSKPDQMTGLKLDDPLLHWRDHFSSPADVQHWAEGRLKAISHAIIPQPLLRSPQLLQIVHRSWPRLALDWARLFELGWNPAHAHVEYTFGRNDSPLVVPVKDRMIQVTGAIDVIHHQANGSWVLSDYKTSSTPTSSFIQAGLEPQLVLYALCVQVLNDQMTAANGAISYWNMRTGEFQTISVGEALRSSWQTAFKDQKLDLATLLTDFTDKWTQRMDQIVNMGRFFADPSHCRYCEYVNICRKDDPRYADRIQAQKAVAP